MKAYNKAYLVNDTTKIGLYGVLLLYSCFSYCNQKDNIFNTTKMLTLEYCS